MICSSCGYTLQPDAKFCTRCGAAVAPAPTAVAPAAAEPGGWMQRLARLFGAKPAVPADPVTPQDAAPGRLPDTLAWETPTNPFPPAHAPVAPVESMPQQLPYRLNTKFLTRAEASFFRVLQLALPDGVLLCPKVNLQDLFWAPPNDYTARNRIDRKHVDFVLADSNTLQPLCGIELDDRSHQRPDRQERDRFVEAVFAAASLPLVRVPVSAGYDPEELGAALRAAIVQAPSPARHRARGAPASAATPPACPKCGTSMVLRTTKHGAKAGETFFGCTGYPRCHGIVTI